MAVNQQDELTSGTLDGLELRLKKLEGLMTGYIDGDEVEAPSGKDENVAVRIERMEAAMEKLSSTSRPVADLLRLYRDHSELFPPSTTLPPNNSFSTRERLAMVNSCATLYSTTASQLTLVEQLKIPDAEQSTALIALQPRLAAAEGTQARQSRELAKLRLRTARVLQRWYDITVMGGNECWAEWDDRLMDAERMVRREEARKESEKGPI